MEDGDINNGEEGGLEASPGVVPHGEPRGVVVLGRPPSVLRLTEGSGEAPGPLDVRGDAGDAGEASDRSKQ